MKKDKRDVLILVLAITVILLLGIIGYVFLIRPAINGLVIQGYNQAQVDLINTILAQVQTNGFVQIPTGEDQSIILVPYQQPQSEETSS